MSGFAQIGWIRTLSSSGFLSQQLELEWTQFAARPGGRVAGATCQYWEGKAGTRPLTSGGSLKTLSRKRPRLNSISRAEPLATVTRLRWFRENMLAAPCSVCSLRSWCQSPARAWAPVPRRPPSHQCSRESPQLPGSQTPPPETTPGLGRARHPPLPPPPKARPVPGHQANLGRQFQSQRHPKSLQHGLRASTLLAGLAHLNLGWVSESPPQLQPPPVRLGFWNLENTSHRDGSLCSLVLAKLGTALVSPFKPQLPIVDSISPF